LDPSWREKDGERPSSVDAGANPSVHEIFPSCPNKPYQKDAPVSKAKQPTN